MKYTSKRRSNHFQEVLNILCSLSFICKTIDMIVRKKVRNAILDQIKGNLVQYLAFQGRMAGVSRTA